MSEIELKFQVARARRDAVARAMATATASTVHLHAQYFDTPDRRLAGAKLALRVRRQGRHWVQTLKAAGDGLWHRLEHEVPLPGGLGGVPTVDVALHAGTPEGQALQRALGGAELSPTYGTRVRRVIRLVRTSGCVVELAFDVGALLAAGRRWPLCELEFELKSGGASAMAALAARWVTRFDLTLDVRSKSERGDRLARGVRLDAPVKAQALVMVKGIDSRQALRAVVGNGLAQALPNASDIAHGDSSAEHLHQLRIGVRRLRTALREFGDIRAQLRADAPARLATVFAGLGTARDRDALELELMPALRRAGVPDLQLPAATAEGDPAQALRDAATTRLWLELMAFTATGTNGGEPFVDVARRRLQRLHRQVRRDARRFERLDDPARHRLRKRVKRLRYLCEFSASQFPAKAWHGYLRKLTPVQDALGVYNDIAVARRLFGERAGANEQAMFALGWLARERDIAAERALRALAVLRKAQAFW